MCFLLFFKGKREFSGKKSIKKVRTLDFCASVLTRSCFKKLSARLTHQLCPLHANKCKRAVNFVVLYDLQANLGRITFEIQVQKTEARWLIMCDTQMLL